MLQLSPGKTPARRGEAGRRRQGPGTAGTKAARGRMQSWKNPSGRGRAAATTSAGPRPGSAPLEAGGGPKNKQHNALVGGGGVASARGRGTRTHPPPGLRALDAGRAWRNLGRDSQAGGRGCPTRGARPPGPPRTQLRGGRAHVRPDTRAARSSAQGRGSYRAEEVGGWQSGGSLGRGPGADEEPPGARAFEEGTVRHPLTPPGFTGVQTGPPGGGGREGPQPGSRPRARVSFGAGRCPGLLAADGEAAQRAFLWKRKVLHPLTPLGPVPAQIREPPATAVGAALEARI